MIFQKSAVQPLIGRVPTDRRTFDPNQNGPKLLPKIHLGLATPYFCRN